MPRSEIWLWPFILCYGLSAVLLALYGLHSLWLLWRFFKSHPPKINLALTSGYSPTVLVQLPVYNERDVVERLLVAVGKFDWPSAQLRIQLLDDSTDDSAELGQLAVEKLRQQGLYAQQLRRQCRTGFKAGALEFGLAEDARHPEGPAEYIAIFDADFVPKPDFLQRAIPVLTQDSGLAFVQGRWEHLNREASLITRAQALGIDGHFAIEQAARAWGGLALNFNGTCGVWRRTAIEQSGGWQHDTLTEDLDLSYRAHLAGWRAAYCMDLAVPGELPATLTAWRSQQYRWARGSLQTARKLLPRVWSSTWSRTAKIAATLHLTHYLVHPLIMLNLCCAPLILGLGSRSSLPYFGIIFLLCSMLPPSLLYVVSQRVLHRPWRSLWTLPALTAMGTGIAVLNTRAALAVCFRGTGVFVRTPKQGHGRGSYRAKGANGIAEIFCALWASIGVGMGLNSQSYWFSPVLALYALGFAHHGLLLFVQRLQDLSISLPFLKIRPILSRPKNSL